MLTRIISAIVGIILISYLNSVGGLAFFIAVGILNILAIWELTKAFQNLNINIAFPINTAFSIILLYIISFVKSSSTIAPLYFILMVMCVFFYGIISERQNLYDIVFTVFSFIYPTILFIFFILIRKMPLGMSLVWWIFITTWACDTGAFFTGIYFGKRKLLPSVSPNKTIEGSIGGIIFSSIASLIFTIWILPNISGADAIICGILMGVFSQVGDLSASLIKRYCKIKDFSNIIPGHGGILDRFDSALFSFPIAYIYIIIFIHKGGFL